MDSEGARAALEDVTRQRVAVVDHAMPRWVSPALAVALGGFFVVEGLAAPAVAAVLTTVYWLGFVGVLGGVWWRARRERQAKLASALVPPPHRLRAAVYGALVAVLALIGALGHDVLEWQRGLVAYGVVSGLGVAAGCWWLRRRLQADLDPDPTARAAGVRRELYGDQ